jgi:hypothetical protein
MQFALDAACDCVPGRIHNEAIRNNIAKNSFTSTLFLVLLAIKQKPPSSFFLFYIITYAWIFCCIFVLNMTKNPAHAVFIFSNMRDFIFE